MDGASEKLPEQGKIFNSIIPMLHGGKNGLGQHVPDQCMAPHCILPASYM